MFVKATELDPSYARAYAGIADCDTFLLTNDRTNFIRGNTRDERKGTGAR